MNVYCLQATTLTVTGIKVEETQALDKIGNTPYFIFTLFFQHMLYEKVMIESKFLAVVWRNQPTR